MGVKASVKERSSGAGNTPEKAVTASKTSVVKVYVWDLFTRVFHWGLVMAVALSFYTVKSGGAPFLFPMEAHAQAGYVVLGLLVFRWIWGLGGTRHARFAHFLKPLGHLYGYVRDLVLLRPHHYAGHNPLGGLVVMVFLVSLTFQAGSGIFLSDDIFFEGPLYSLVNSDTSSILKTLHYRNGQFLIYLIALHLIAMVVHRLLGERLVSAMFTGTKRFTSSPVDGEPAESASCHPVMACLAIAGGILVTASLWFW